MRFVASISIAYGMLLGVSNYIVGTRFIASASVVCGMLLGMSKFIVGT